jgi:transposase
VLKAKTKSFGLFYLLREISRDIGLEEILQRTLPERWKEVFMLACYLVSCGDPFNNCCEWLECTESYAVGEMNSQDISRLLQNIKQEQRDNFFDFWCRKRQEEEYLALDITSTSSYSELIDDVEWGYNRDKEKLAQINICMLMGEKSFLPIYQITYSGSLGDVSTLKNTLDCFSSLSTFSILKLVMDKGFYSQENIDYLLNNDLNIEFLVAVPFKSLFARKEVDINRQHIKERTNAIKVNNNILHAISNKYHWNDDNMLNIHTYFNSNKYTFEVEAMTRKILELKEEATKDPKKYINNKKYNKFLNFKRDKKDEYDITINSDTYEKSIKYAGWLVLLSNNNFTANECINIYRNKDIVEKGFLKLKRRLDLQRTRCHSQTTLDNKIFISFIALILMSKIHLEMYNNNLYKNYTLKKLLNEVNKIKKITIKNKTMLYPITKNQKDIFIAFKIAAPTL